MGFNVDNSSRIFDLEKRVSSLEKLVDVLTNRISELDQQEKVHFLRANNNERVSDDFIIGHKKYHDLSPEKAFNIYNDKDRNFILLDVQHEDFEPIADFPEVTRIPLEMLVDELKKIPNKATSILVISERGVRSIIACEVLYNHGYYNINNVSGGYKYWPGFNNLKSISRDSISA